MAAGRIKGITIEIGGDTTKLVKALSAVDNAISRTQQNLRDINKALKFDPSNTTLLKDKQQELGKQVEATQKRIEEEKKALEQLNEKLDQPFDLDHAEEFQKNAKAAEDLKLQIDLDTAALKQLEEQARQSSSVLGTQMQVAGQKIQEVGQKIQEVGDRISGFGQSMATYVTTPIVTAFGGSVKAAMDWESAFTGVMKTVDETSTTTYEDLKKNINEIAKTTASSQNEIAAVMEIAGQLGVSADSITGFTRTMVELGDTTNLTAEEAASSIAKFANVTKMSLDDTDKLGSSLVDLGNNFATTEADIMSMATRLSGAGAQIGLTQGEILGFATALSSVGIEAEMGGSAFSKAMIKMQVAAETGYEPVIDLTERTGLSLRQLELLSANNSKDFKALADSLNLTATEMNNTITAGKNLNDFAEIANMETEDFVKLYRDDAPAALQAFIQGLGDVEGHGESTITMLQEMGFTEVRLRDTLTRLANSGDLVTDAVTKGNEAWNENTAMTEEANKRYATMEAKMSQVKASLTEVAVSIGETLMPYIEKAAEKIQELADKWKALTPEQQEAIIKFMAIAAAIGPVLVIIGTLVSSIGSIVSTIGGMVSGIGSLISAVSGAGGAMGALQAAIAALTGPIGIVVTAVAAFAAGIAYLYATSESFRETVNRLAGSIKENFGRAMEEIKPKLEELGERFNSFMQTLEPVFEGILTLVVACVNGIISTIGPVVDFITGIVEVIMGIIQAFFALFTGDWDSFWQGIETIIDGAINMIEGFLNAGTAIWEGILSTFGINMNLSVTDMWEKAKKTIQNVIEKIRTDIKEKWNDIKTWLADTLHNIWDKFKEIFEAIRESVKEKIDNTKQAIEEGMELAIDYLASLPSRFFNWGAEMIGNLIDGIKSKFSDLVDAVGEVAETIAEYIHFSEPDVGPLSNFHTFMPDMIDMMVNGINQGIPKLQKAMGGMAGSMASPMPGGGTTYAGTTNVNLTVYGAPGQDISALADVIEQRIAMHSIRRGAAGA